MVESTLPQKPVMKDILKAVWENETITSQCPDLVIRLTSLRGQVLYIASIVFGSSSSS